MYLYLWRQHREYYHPFSSPPTPLSLSLCLNVGLINGRLCAVVSFHPVLVLVVVEAAPTVENITIHLAPPPHPLSLSLCLSVGLINGGLCSVLSSPILPFHPFPCTCMLCYTLCGRECFLLYYTSCSACTPPSRVTEWPVTW